MNNLNTNVFELIEDKALTQLYVSENKNKNKDINDNSQMNNNEHTYKDDFVNEYEKQVQECKKQWFQVCIKIKKLWIHNLYTCLLSK